MRNQTAGEHPLDPNSYDWRYAFQCCGSVEGEPENEDYAFNTPDVRHAHPQDTETSLAPFQRADVEEVRAYEEGENDGPDWLCVGKLKDGRWFCLSAGCDYTGWDCQSGGSATVASDYTTLLAFGITDEQARRLRLRP